MNELTALYATTKKEIKKNIYGVYCIDISNAVSTNDFVGVNFIIKNISNKVITNINPVINVNDDCDVTEYECTVSTLSPNQETRIAFDIEYIGNTIPKEKSYISCLINYKIDGEFNSCLLSINNVRLLSQATIKQSENDLIIDSKFENDINI